MFSNDGCIDLLQGIDLLLGELEPMSKRNEQEHRSITIRDILMTDYHFPLEIANETVELHANLITESSEKGHNYFSIARSLSEIVDLAAKRSEQQAAVKPSRILLPNHTSFETAYLQHDYPFGYTTRCLRNVWLEQSTSGAKKGEYRFATCTTTKNWNHVYTDALAGLRKIVAQQSQAPLEECDLVELLRSLPEPTWNKPKYSTYHHFAVLFQDLNRTDDQGAPYLFYSALTLYSEVKQFYAFYDQWWEQMHEGQRKDFIGLVRTSARLNGETYWLREEEQMGRTELQGLRAW